MIIQKFPHWIVATGIFLFLSAVLNAQTKRFLAPQMGLGDQLQRDEGMSLLHYQGAVLAGGLSYIKVDKQKTEWLELDFAGGMLKNRFDNELFVFKGDLTTYTFYHSNKAYARWVLVGWSNQNVLSFRQNSSFTNYKERFDYFTCFGPAAHFYYRFSLGKTNWCFQTRTNYQLLGFFIRPSFATNEPEGFVDPNATWVHGFFQSVELFIPGKAMSFKLNPSLIFELKSGNFLSLEYNFAFYRLNSVKRVQQLDGCWYLTWATRLSQFL